MKNIILLLAITLLSFFTSCKDDEVLQSKNLTVTHISESIARFDSQEEFDQSIENYQSDEVLPINLTGITSLTASYQLKSSEIENFAGDEDSLVVSDALKNFVNSNHEIIIEGVYFKITKTGTYFTTEKNLDKLKNLLVDETLYADAHHVTEALGYFYKESMYKLNTEDDIYFFDTYRIKDPIIYENLPKMKSLKLATINPRYFPFDVSWRESNDGRTLVGKAWDIWGFSKSLRNNFDSKHRVDVKFYAQRFPFYSEMGIKTKTQKRDGQVFGENKLSQILQMDGNT